MVNVVCVYAQSAGASVVHLAPEAIVTSESITLGDICRLRGFDEKKALELQELPVTVGVRSHDLLIVTAADVQRILREAGLNLSDIVITGASECHIIDSAGTAEMGEQQPERRPLDYTSLQQSVQRAFEDALRHLGGAVHVRFGATRQDAYELPNGESQFSIRIVDKRRLGSAVRVVADVYVDGIKRTTLPLIANVSITKTTVVARKAINMKSVIASEDVERVERIYESEERVPKETLTHVVGMRAKRFVPLGSVIRMSDLETVPLVLRGQLVDVVSVAGRIDVRSVAKALGDGGLGDPVMVQTGDRRGDRLAATITGRREVTVGATVQPRKSEVRLALGRHDAK